MNTNFSITLKNKGFMVLEESFLQHNWKCIKNEMDHILYQKHGNDYDNFEMNITQNKICVSVPIKNSRFQYKTHFESYFNACEYVEMHLLNYEKKDEVKTRLEDKEDKEDKDGKDGKEDESEER